MIYNIIRKVVENGKIPNEWRSNFVIPLFRKGDKKRRGITAALIY